MSDKTLARRVELRLTFTNVDVPDNIALHLLSAVYTDAESDTTDDLQIVYDDRENNLLGKWLDIKPTIIKTTKQVTKTVTKEKVVNYVVKRGDTLWAIAARYLGSGTKYTQIAQENNIPNPNLIYPGQVFKITTGGETKSTVTETVKKTQKVAKAKMMKAVLVQKNWNDTGKDVTLD